MRDWTIVGEIFLVQVRFFKMRMNRATFELIRKDASGERKIDNFCNSRKKNCRTMLEEKFPVRKIRIRVTWLG
jgi:hypothetical protein